MNGDSLGINNKTKVGGTLLVQCLRKVFGHDFGLWSFGDKVTCEALLAHQLIPAHREKMHILTFFTLVVALT